MEPVQMRARVIANLCDDAKRDDSKNLQQQATTGTMDACFALPLHGLG